jgi:carbon monoxide dehydrogenase subunit G
VITVERRVEVSRSVRVVFAYLSDFTNTNKWDPGTVRTTRTDSGPLGLGSTFHNVSRFRGKQTELDYELVRLEPNRHLTFTGKNSTVIATDDFSFAPSRNEATLITYRANFTFQGRFRLAEPFLRNGFEPIADETVAQLKQVLESLA